MAEINEFIKKLGDDIGVTFAPRIEAQVVQTGNQIADRAAPKVQAFADQLLKDFAAAATPKVRDFSNQLVKDIFAQQSTAIRDFVISMVQGLVGRYEPSLAGNLNTTIVDQAIVLASNDIRLEFKERATGKLVASLDLPVNFRIDVKDMFIKLDAATIQLKDVQL